MAEIPRVTEEGKTHILGPTAIGTLSEHRVVKEIKERGHPLFWGEWKPVQLFSTLYNDLHVSDVVDVTPGSGAACVAAMYNNIPYYGFSINEKHRKWFLDHIQKVFLALVYGKEVAVDKGIFDNVKKYLQRSAEAAKHVLPSGTAFMDCVAGHDDSEDDED